jgi:hypothetical protein
MKLLVFISIFLVAMFVNADIIEYHNSVRIKLKGPKKSKTYNISHYVKSVDTTPKSKHYLHKEKTIKKYNKINATIDIKKIFNENAKKTGDAIIPRKKINRTAKKNAKYAYKMLKAILNCYDTGDISTTSFTYSGSGTPTRESKSCEGNKASRIYRYLKMAHRQDKKSRPTDQVELKHMFKSIKRPKDRTYVVRLNYNISKDFEKAFKGLGIKKIMCHKEYILFVIPDYQCQVIYKESNTCQDCFLVPDKPFYKMPRP